MRRTVAAVGRVLVTVGLLILGFVAYQLWGTGVLQARAQDQLADQFDALQAELAADSQAPTTTTPPEELDPTLPDAPEAGPVELPTIRPGDPLGRIIVPEAGVDEYFVAGVGRSDLQKGPGHYPGTPLPGQVGNAAIAGHRTTYGAPFFDLDKVEPGDWIVTETLLGTHVFVVQWTQVVEPTRVEVVGPVAEDPTGTYLTLTTCNPKYSARERLIVRAKLLDPGDIPPPGAPEGFDGAVSDVEIAGEAGTVAESAAFGAVDATSLESGLEGTGTVGPAIVWGTATMLVGLAWWWAFRRWRLLLTWVLGAIPFVVVLIGFYVYLERLLPSSY